MICVPIAANKRDEVIEKILKANSVADMLEFRLDLMGDPFSVDEMRTITPLPVIATYRSIMEGGKGEADYERSLFYLLEAIDSGADFVDVEYRMPLKYRERIFKRIDPERIIISCHILNRNPDIDELKDLLFKMAETGADILKIVIRAEQPEDNIKALSLIPLAKRLGKEIISFCTGWAGRISRIATVLVGGYLTFASLEEGEETAEGQIPAKKMKRLLEVIAS